jgi:GTPase involved in cell partitioning and DNA repair
MIAYVIDLNDDSPDQTILTLKKELELYSKELARKKSIIIYNKSDLFQQPPSIKQTGILISAITGKGLNKLKNKIMDILKNP